MVDSSGCAGDQGARVIRTVSNFRIIMCLFWYRLRDFVVEEVFILNGVILNERKIHILFLFRV